MSDVSFNSAVPLVNINVTPSGLNGRDGIDGAPGRDGIDGAPGRDGTNGRDGTDGAPGRDGIDGLPGRDGTNGRDGVDGAPGRDGIDGAPGRDGIDGQDGTGITAVTIDERNHLILTLSNGTTQDAGLLDAVDQVTLDTIAKLDDIKMTRTNAPTNRGTEPYDGAVLTFTDDDGTLRFLTEHVSVYRNHGVTATTSVVACRAITTVGITTSGDPYEAMSFEQLRALTREGFDVQSHTWSHARTVFNSEANQDTTDAAIDLEYKRADEAFRQNGFDYNCMVFPWGAHQARHLSLARRYARFGVNCRGTDGQNDGLGDPMDLNRLSAGTNGSNLAQLKAAIDSAIQRNGWLIILTHAGATQPDAASLDELLTYAQTAGIRIENFREAARLKAPAYYAGQGNTAFRVMPDGKTMCSMTDATISALIARAYELGYISPMANVIDSLTIAWTGGMLHVGDMVDTTLISVTANLHNGGTRTITDFTVDGALTVAEGPNTLTVRYGTLSGTVTINAIVNNTPATTLLAEYTTRTSGGSERERVWFARHMEAGTYALHMVLSEPIGESTSTSSAFVLKTASVFGESTGTELFSVSALTMQGLTSIDGTITLTEATDGFFLFAKPLKKNIMIQFYVDGEVTDSALMDAEPIVTLQGSAAVPGEGWFPVNLASGSHAYKLEVGGAAESTVTAFVVKTAASDGDTTGETLLSFTGKQCNGGMTIMDIITLSSDVSYLYVRFAPETRSTFTTTLLMI